MLLFLLNIVPEASSRNKSLLKVYMYYLEKVKKEFGQRSEQFITMTSTSRLLVLMCIMSSGSLAVDLELGGGGRQFGQLGESDREHSIFELGVGVGHVSGLG